MGTQTCPSSTAARWTFFSCFWANKNRLEYQLLKVRGAALPSAVTGDKPCGSPEMAFGVKTDNACCFSFSSIQLFRLIFICFSESSSKRWWAISEKMCLCPPKGTTSTYKPNPPPAGAAARSVLHAFPPSSNPFPLVAHSAILLSTFKLSPADCPIRRAIITKKWHLGPRCISASPAAWFSLAAAGSRGPGSTSCIRPPHHSICDLGLWGKDWKSVSVS